MEKTRRLGRDDFYSQIFKLVLPIIIQNLLSAAVSSADVVMLNYVGQSSISAVSLAAQYAKIVAFSFLFDSLAQVYIAAHRSMANPMLGLYILGASMVSNTILNWVFIFGKLGAPALGVRGAAVATLTARLLEITIVILHMMKNRFFRIHLHLLLKPGVDMTRRFLKYGGLVVCNETMWGLGTSVFPTIMGHMAGSTEILAAYTIAGNMEKITMVVSFGLASTASIIIGREIGAGRPDKVLDVGKALNTLAVAGGIILGGLLLAFVRFAAPAWVYPLFKLSPTAGGICTMMLTVIFIMMPLRSFETTNIVGVLRGGGDVTAATVIDITPLWLVSLPLAVLAGLVLKMGIFWVQLATVSENIVKCILGLWRFRGGKWINDVTISVKPGAEG